jgi:hypothetical protein
LLAEARREAVPVAAFGAFELTCRAADDLASIADRLITGATRRGSRLGAAAVRRKASPVTALALTGTALVQPGARPVGALPLTGSATEWRLSLVAALLFTSPLPLRLLLRRGDVGETKLRPQPGECASSQEAHRRPASTRAVVHLPRQHFQPTVIHCFLTPSLATMPCCCRADRVPCVRAHSLR